MTQSNIYDGAFGEYKKQFKAVKFNVSNHYPSMQIHIKSNQLSAILEHDFKYLHSYQKMHKNGFIPINLGFYL